MKYKNSFFRVEIRDDGVYLVLYPSQNGGKNLDIKEVIEYLESNGIILLSKSEIKEAIENLSVVSRILITKDRISEINEQSKVIISQDKMYAFVRFYPPSTNGKLMSKKEIIAELTRAGIKYGISDKIMDVFSTSRQYCLNIPMAKGKDVILAKDAIIEYHFETKPLSKPSVLDDGSVDFHQLNLFTRVSKGDLLAQLIPEELGENGINVFGVEVTTTKPKKKFIKHGRNISRSDDGLAVFSMVDGDVSLTDGTIFVSDTYSVAADVDASTGDIDYDGNIQVTGTVRTGFSIKAKGNIQINGVVEGATVIAGGDIVIKRGVQGMNKGYLEAGGDICANFFESASANARGTINAGSILHSNIVAGDKVIVSGKKGFIIGGEVTSEVGIEVNNIGNKVETNTLIKVGVKPQLFQEMKKLMSKVNELNSSIEEISSYLNVYKKKIKMGTKLTPENIKKIKEYNGQFELLSKEKNEKQERLLEIKEEIDLGKKGYIKVVGNLYRGCSLMIATCVYISKETEKHSVYKVVDGCIEPVAF